jgi:hypothetical protein
MKLFAAVKELFNALRTQQYGTAVSRAVCRVFAALYEGRLKSNRS